MSLLTTDSWFNPTTGVGGAKDKTAGFVFNAGAYRMWDYPQILEALYESDELAAIKVDAVVDDSFSKGWAVEASGLTPEQAEAVIEFNDRIKIKSLVVDADKWARLFGGGAVFIGSNDGTQEAPLLLGGDVHFAQAYERDELYPSRWYSNPLHPKFGRPSHYRLTPLSTALTGEMAAGYGRDIHETRFLLFYGATTTKRRRVENLGWGSSVLLRPMTALKQFNGAYALVLSLLADANQNIYKLEGFAELALSGRGDAIEKRIALIDKFRSATQALIVDAKTEDFVRSQLSLSGIDGILTSYKERLAAAFEMPITRLLGVSPAGLNATGESDERNWYKQVTVHQEDILRPALERWMRVVFSARNGPTRGLVPDSFKVKFPPLRDVTPREQAEIDSVNAQTDTVYHDLGILKVHEIAKARFSAEPTRPLLDADAIAAIEEADKLASATTTTGDTPEPAPALLGAPPPDGQSDSVDSDTVDTALQAYVDQMTQHGVERCPHGKTNRCKSCGIERVRELMLDPSGAPMIQDGVPACTVKWRIIGQFAPAQIAAPVTADSIDAFNPNQPRADDGKFGEGSGGASASGATKSAPQDRRATVKSHVATAHAADRERTANSKVRLVEAKAEHKHLTQQARDVDSMLHQAVGDKRLAQLAEIDTRQKHVDVLTERVRATEAGERLHSPEGIAVQRDLPAAKQQLADAHAHIAKLRNDVGPEAPEHTQMRQDRIRIGAQADDVEAEVEHHQRIVKGEAKREKAFGELNAAVEAGDRKAIKRAQTKVSKALGESNDEVFDDEAFTGLNHEEFDISSAFKD